MSLIFLVVWAASGVCQRKLMTMLPVLSNKALVYNQNIFSSLSCKAK